MGRKIPAKKHRGVKDPLAQQAKRVESLKGKINAPPKDPDEQPVPQSLLRLFGMDKVNEKKKGKVKVKREERGGRGGGGGAGGNPVARLRRLPGESARSFARRITGATRALHDVHQQQHYPVEDDDEDEDARWQRRRRRPGPTREARPTRQDKRKLKFKQKKEENAKRQALAAMGRDEVRYERVSFGERAHAPPVLSAPRLPRPSPSTSLHAPAAAAAAAAARPGRRQLLLTRMLVGAAQGERVEGAAGELRRLDAVAAYRALKAQRRATPPPRARAAADGRRNIHT